MYIFFYLRRQTLVEANLCMDIQEFLVVTLCGVYLTPLLHQLKPDSFNLLVNTCQIFCANLKFENNNAGS